MNRKKLLALSALIGWTFVSVIASSIASYAQATDDLALVICPPGRWAGNALQMKDGNAVNVDNFITLKQARYTISRKQGKVLAFVYDDKAIDFLNLHYFQNSSVRYFAISYIIGGVLSIDTIFSDGRVYSQSSKASLGLFPVAETFGKQCAVQE